MRASLRPLAWTKRALARIALSRQIGRHKPVALQGITWPFLGIVRNGTIFAVMSSPEGREQILHESGPFEPFGEIMILDGGDSVARFGALLEPAEVFLRETSYWIKDKLQA